MSDETAAKFNDIGAKVLAQYPGMVAKPATWHCQLEVGMPQAKVIPVYHRKSMDEYELDGSMFNDLLAKPIDKDYIVSVGVWANGKENKLGLFFQLTRCIVD